ncbi:MAG: translesion error-prone DNA polymerase V autoproteolytic subunit [Herminiimonas sp.]|nr:translesion error-prone DNA polymerase V autoproteolytic subunit [Herminiimonas sp.]
MPDATVAACSCPPAVVRPLFLQRVSAGFPSPAEDYLEKGLDLNTYLVRNRTATFYFRVQGDSMTGARIFDGDMLVVDRSIQPRHGHIVLAVVNASYTIKELYRRGAVVELRAANPLYAPIRFQDGECLEIWGVVVGTVCRFEA